RSVRVPVERGSMPYSAVTQPRPLLRRNGGTRSSMLAVQSTWVSPKPAKQEPSADLLTPGSRAVARRASAARAEGRLRGARGGGAGGGPPTRCAPAGPGPPGGVDAFGGRHYIPTANRE